MQDLAIITSLIDQARTSDEEDKKRKQEQIQETIKSLRAKAVAQLGEAWSALAGVMQEKVTVKDNGQRIVIEWSLLPGKTFELELSPIEILISNHGYERSGISVWNQHGYNYQSFAYSQVAEALYYSRSNYLAYSQQVETEYIRTRAPKLDWWNNRDEDVARQAHKELVDAIPGQSSEWDKKLHHWLQVDQEQKRKLEESAKEQEKEEQLKAAYRLALEAYLKTKDQVRKHNATALAPLQEVLDVPFDVWKLTYAIFARDEEGESILEERTAWLAQPDPDPETGEYVLTDGRKRKYFNPVSIEKMTFKPTDELIGTYRQVQVHTHCLYVSSWMDPAHVDELIQSAGFLPLPEEPSIPEGLGSWDAQNIRFSLSAEDRSYAY